MTNRRLYKQAVHFVKHMDDIGISDLQRHFNLNFVQAHDLLATMINTSILDQQSDHGRCKVIKK